MKIRSKDPIRGGVLFSKTGVTSVIESSEQRATLLATEEINQAGGINARELELVWYDPESRPALSGAGREADLERSRSHHPRLLHVEHAQGVVPVVEKFKARLLPTWRSGLVLP